MFDALLSTSNEGESKKIMRYAGPRMLLHNPGLALYHVFDGRKKPQTLEEFKKKKAQSSA
jgi:hypothetical protein